MYLTNRIIRVFLKPSGSNINNNNFLINKFKIGISFRSLPVYSKKQLDDILVRNPNVLNLLDFALPCGGEEKCPHVPFLIINTAMLGPMQGMKCLSCK